ncbi:phage/plasmid replication domain-containing protein [Terrilactibacillus laevilacticus]|uniref:Phage/plasmid replication protein n=1 Tax=Terrilactibacillus laevilacticus TaxID=1380157 RepID=A0ABW5PTZ8_9BACI|nr:phage/plasmid replication protein [Terrilactibacillus laevilacticus]
MIHTAEFFIHVNIAFIRNLENLYRGKNINLIFAEIENLYPGIRIWSAPVKFRHAIFKINLFVDFIKLLGRKDSIIDEDDYEEIEAKLNEVCQKIEIRHIDLLTLSRLDYRFDAVINNDAVRSFLVKRYKKLFDHYRFKEKNDLYDTTIYFNSKSLRTVCYDKEEERKKRPYEQNDYEKNVLRFEVSLSTKTFYNNWKRKNLNRTLKNYLTKEQYWYYMERNVVDLFGIGDFYKCYQAKKIIEGSDEPDNMKKKLEIFLNNISKKGLEKV